jgi:hypothetical protein
MMMRFFPERPIDRIATALALAVAVVKEVEAATQENLTQRGLKVYLTEPENTIVNAVLGAAFLVGIVACCVVGIRHCCKQQEYHEVDDETAAINARTRVREADERAGLSP